MIACERNAREQTDSELIAEYVDLVELILKRVPVRWLSVNYANMSGLKSMVDRARAMSPSVRAIADKMLDTVDLDDLK